MKSRGEAMNHLVEKEGYPVPMEYNLEDITNSLLFSGLSSFE